MVAAGHSTTAHKFYAPAITDYSWCEVFNLYKFVAEISDKNRNITTYAHNNYMNFCKVKDLTEWKGPQTCLTYNKNIMRIFIPVNIASNFKTGVLYYGQI